MDHRGAAASVRDEVSRENPDSPVLQLSLPPVILGLGLGDDSDSVAGDKTQVARLLPRERMGRRDNQLPAGPAHWWPTT